MNIKRNGKVHGNQPATVAPAQSQPPPGAASPGNELLDILTLWARLQDIWSQIEALGPAFMAFMDKSKLLIESLPVEGQQPSGVELAALEEMCAAATAAIGSVEQHLEAAGRHALACKLVIGAANQRLQGLRHYPELPEGAQVANPRETDREK